MGWCTWLDIGIQFEWLWLFTQGHRITRKLDLCNYSVVKWHEIARTFAGVDYVMEMTRKNVSMVNMDHLRICSSCFFFVCFAINFFRFCVADLAILHCLFQTRQVFSFISELQILSVPGWGVAQQTVSWLPSCCAVLYFLLVHASAQL